MAKINRSLAIVIGINQYMHIPQLKNAVSDAVQLASVLKDIYGYEVLLLVNQRATKAELDKLVTNLQNKTIQFDNKLIQVDKSDRVLFYFAGHGFASEAGENEDGKPAGYFMPQDAKDSEPNTWLSMEKLYKAFTALDCHHLLMILDCCFAGRISWVGKGRNAARSRKLFRQSYDRFIKYPTQQIITSAAHDEEAQDLSRFGQRGEKNGHSPFADLLLKVLQGNSDGGRDKSIEAIVEDKVITVHELFTYLQNKLGEVAERQTPDLFKPLKKENDKYVDFKGEYIFPLPDFNPENLTKLKLDKTTNPYKGLASFETKDSQLFYGRKKLIEEPNQGLLSKVSDHPLTVVLGASGSGKSSLVKAGLIPALNENWQVLNPMRPGEYPFKALNKILTPSESSSSLILSLTPEEQINTIFGKIADLIPRNSESKLLLVIDQAEELLTLCGHERERENFLNLLADLLAKYQQKLRIVLTLRSDFEPQLRDAIEENHWQKVWQDGRFMVTPMNREELQQAIEEPAAQRTLFFESPKLVNDLIDEVIQMPGALPLLSFTLSELYLRYLKAEENRERDDRTITEADYQEIGGVTRSLTQTADKTYEELVEKEKVDESTIRNVMLRMVAISGGELARRIVPTSELVYPEPKKEQVKEVIDRFLEARLLVKGLDAEGQEYVEPVHDALVTGWGKIKYWLDEKQKTVEKVSRWNQIKERLNASLGKVTLPLASKENSSKSKSDRPKAKQSLKVNLPLQRELTTAAFRWYDKNKETQFLWNASPYLDVLKQVLQSEQNNWFNQVEKEFVKRSVGKKRQNTSIRWGIAIAVMLGLSTGLVFSLIGQRNTLINQGRASVQSAQANLRLNQSLDGMVDSLQAGKALQHPLVQNDLLQLFGSTKRLEELQDRIEDTLQWAVYRVKETNRMTGDSSIIVRSIVSPSSNSPNDQIIASAGEDGSIKLWNLQGELLQSWKEGSKRVRNVAFSPDRQLLASSGEDGQVRIWELPEIQNLPAIQLEEIKANKEILAHEGYVRYVSFSSDAKKLASAGGEDGKIKLWDLQGKPLASWKADEEGFAKTVNFHPHDRLIVTSGKERNIKIWNLEAKLLQTLDFNAWGAFFSSNGKYLVGAGDDGTIGVWKSQDRLWNFQKKWQAHEGRIWNVAFSPDSQQIASGGDDGTAGLWDLEGQQLAKFQGHTGPVRSVRFTADGKQLVSSGDDGTTRLWNLPNYQLTNYQLDERHLDSCQDSEGKIDKIVLSPEKDNVNDLSCSSNGELLASAGEDGKIDVWNLKTGEKLNTFQDHVGQVLKLDFSSDSQRLVSAGEDKTIRVWDDVDKIGVGRYSSIFQVYEEEIPSAGKDTSNKYKITAVIFSPDDQRIISSDNTGYIRFWNLKQNQQTAIWKAHHNAINELNFSPDGDLLATVGKEDTVWPIESFDELRKRGCNQIDHFLQNKTKNNVEERGKLCDEIKSRVR